MGEGLLPVEGETSAGNSPSPPAGAHAGGPWSSSASPGAPTHAGDAPPPALPHLTPPPRVPPGQVRRLAWPAGGCPGRAAAVLRRVCLVGGGGGGIQAGRLGARPRRPAGRPAVLLLAAEEAAPARSS